MEESKRKSDTRKAIKNRNCPFFKKVCIDRECMLWNEEYCNCNINNIVASLDDVNINLIDIENEIN